MMTNYDVISYTIASASFGEVLAAFSRRGLCYLSIGSSSDELLSNLHRRFSLCEFAAETRRDRAVLARIISAVEGSQPLPPPMLDLRGSDFQQQVWTQLLRIEFGKTCSYGQIARALRQPRASRAVARACAANPIAIVVPCHRVVRSDGTLGGYRWGLKTKAALLAKEGVHAPVCDG